MLRVFRTQDHSSVARDWMGQTVPCREVGTHLLQFNDFEAGFVATPLLASYDTDPLVDVKYEGPAASRAET